MANYFCNSTNPAVEVGFMISRISGKNDQLKTIATILKEKSN
ncbi:hypothetical protein [uncultured Flavobacterium sp.]|nr:hypothetical protein [uncultured Flavobacterium sp.]